MTNSSNPTETSPANRRSFFAMVAALVTGAIVVITPVAAGLATFLSPLFRRRKPPLVRVALLSQVPDDGMPRFFPVTASRVDAWTHYDQQRIGGVYLIRQSGEDKPTAFTAKCPHAGCFIGYAAGDELFRCPCHTSAFKLNGARLHGDAEVSPRNMDTLPVQLHEIEAAEGESSTTVLVEFIEYQTGHKEKIPTA